MNTFIRKQFSAYLRFETPITQVHRQISQKKYTLNTKGDVFFNRGLTIFPIVCFNLSQ